MRLKSLDYFRELVRCGSYTQAAKNLYISQQGLSKSISELEKRLDVSLLERRGRDFVLTEEGELLHTFAEQVSLLHAELEEGLSRVKAFDATANAFSGASLTAMPYICSSLLNTIEKRSGAKLFDDLVLNEDGFSGILEKLRSGRLEFALVNVLEESLPVLEKEDSLGFTPVLSADIVLASAGYLDPRTESPIPLSAIEKMPLAYYNDPVLNCFVERIGANPRKIQHSSSVDRISSLIETGRAVTFVDTFCLPIYEGRTELAVFPLTPTPSFYVGFLAKKDLPQDSQPMRFMLSFQAVLRRYCSEYLEEHPVSNSAVFTTNSC